MTDIRYLITASTGADLLDLHIPNAAVHTRSGVASRYTITGQEVAVFGQVAVNRVMTALGVTVDATALLGGEDVIFFDGAWADYTKNTSQAGRIVFTRTVGSATETITVGNGAILLSRDKLVFADGAVRSDTVRKALAADGLNATVQDLIDEGAATALDSADDWDASMTTTSPGTALPATPSGAISAVAVASTGVEFAMASVGVAHTLFGAAGVDSNYVTPGATVDATALLGGQDIVYFTGAWADYTKDTSQSGRIVFTRPVGSDTETVTVGNGAISLTRDQLVFSDGAVRSDTVRKALTANGLNATVQHLINEGAATTLDSADDWNTTTFTGWVTGAELSTALGANEATAAAVRDFDLRSDIVFTAAGNLTAVTGNNITLHNHADADTTGDILIDAANAAVVLSYNAGADTTSIRINPGFDLDVNATYTLSVAAGAFTSGGQALLAFSTVFATVNPNGADNLARQFAAGATTLTDSATWVDISSDGNGATQTVDTARDFSTGAMVAYAGVATVNAANSFDVNANYFASITGFGANDVLYFDDTANGANYGLVSNFDAALSLLQSGGTGNTTAASPDRNYLEMAGLNGLTQTPTLLLQLTNGTTSVLADSVHGSGLNSMETLLSVTSAPVMVA